MVPEDAAGDEVDVPVSDHVQMMAGSSRPIEVAIRMPR
jgi:hypothetical protein